MTPVSSPGAAPAMRFRVFGIHGVPELAAEADALRRRGGPPGGLGPTGERSDQDRLGWVDLPQSAGPEVLRYRALRLELNAEGFARVLVLAMGGSALAAETFTRGLPAEEAVEEPAWDVPLEVRVLSTLGPEAVRTEMADAEIRRTAFLVASKSGSTAETLALEAVAAEGIRAGGGSAREHFFAVSDPGSGLARRAAAKYRAYFPGIPSVGGRFSGLSAFGLLPAVLAGREVHAGLRAAREARRQLDHDPPPPTRIAEAGWELSDAGFRLGVLLAYLEAAGRWTAWLSAAPPFSAMLVWLEHLFSECTGKEGRGILPVILPSSPGALPSHPAAFRIHLGAEDDGGRQRREALRAGVPWIGFPLTRRDLPAAVFRWQTAVAVAAWRMGLDPYDQPDVETAKAAARRIVDDPASAPEPAPATDSGIREFLRGAAEGGLAVNAFGHQSPAAEAGVARLQRLVANRFGVVPAVGFGSQLLHSLGQVEKGGPPSLRILVLRWGPDGGDVPIPGAGIGAGRLAALQAAADAEDLQRRGRRVLWLDAVEPGDGGLGRLLDRIEAALSG